ncbi:hypothetical protein BJ508DRAFT_216551 [Ascobolus immersus RN42]|uniref:Glycosyltransferase family 24 protein n=1 Tax=Ascobolus immersus RN42 TaxID=1160509 RepID=A0A3N4HKG3_ASCIM|nr:hypothetical protein BJ508DRAFT_216551 [Ascobolus immersus RN42]
MRLQSGVARFVVAAAILGRTNILGVLASSSPSVKVGLRTSWQGPPFLLELLETAAEENSTAYFPLLDRIAAQDFVGYKTEKQLYDRFIEVAHSVGTLLKPEDLASFNFALSIHASAPRVEAQYQYYEQTLVPMMGRMFRPECPVWLLWSSKQVCDTDWSTMLDEFQRFPNNPKALPFDRILNRNDELPTAILLADIESPEFGKFHRQLSERARKGKLSYRVRYRAPIDREARPLPLSGYGVDLALKKTDYLVMDDRQAAEGKEAGTDEVQKAKENLQSGESSEKATIKALHPKDIAFLGTKAGSYVMSQANPLDSLISMLQDFPKHSFAIANTNVSEEFTEELGENVQQGYQLEYGPGANTLWINGLQQGDTQVNAFALLQTLRRERRNIHSLQQLDLTAPEAIQILSHKAIGESKSDGLPQRFDASDDIEGGGVITWLNDLEKDEQYENWSPSLQTFLRQMYPGQLPQVKLNLFNMIVTVDMSKKADVSLVVEQLLMFIERSVAIHMGFVPITNTPESKAQAKVFYYLRDTYGLTAALRYISFATELGDSGPVKKVFEDIVATQTPIEGKQVKEWADITGGEAPLVSAATQWSNRLGMKANPEGAFLNNQFIPRSDETWLRQMSQRVTIDAQVLQRALASQLVSSKDEFFKVLYENIAKRRNKYVYPDDEDTLNLIDIAKVEADHSSVLENLPKVTTLDEDSSYQFDIWVIGDVDESDGHDLLSAAAEAQATIPGIRLSVINNPEIVNDKPALSTLLNRFKELLKSHEQLKQILAEAPPLKHFAELPQVTELAMKVQPGVKTEGWAIPDHMEAAKFWKSAAPLVAKAGLEPGQRGLVINGRVVGPIGREDEFSAEDFIDLIKLEKRKRIDPVIQAATDLGVLEKLAKKDAIPRLANIVLLTSQPLDGVAGIFDPVSPVRSSDFENWTCKNTCIERGDKEKAVLRITASLDPVSSTAQKWAPILKALSAMDGVYLQIFLNPSRVLTELPIKRFYRYVLEAAPTFDSTGTMVAPEATFSNLPEDALLTLTMDVPPSWLVTPSESIHDLDNIKLSTMKSRLNGGDVTAIYSLRNILIEGHSRDLTVGGPPKGAQLTLGTEADPHAADTIVMANLGYFQFKANPGFYELGLKEGRTEEIFEIKSAGIDGYNVRNADPSKHITVLSFEGATIFPRLIRKPGMETEDVLAPTTHKNRSPAALFKKGLQGADNLLTKWGFLAPAPGTKLLRPANAEINIFSVASGHLYERFLNIMMLSVMKHTKSTVKFWFIENYLSPSFKDFLPHMAEKYNFQYELITYKWPHWLRPQTEKQRQIWGYKILFLDVLFPLDLDKVIFVDADQIVRTDLKELVDLDLEGAPYGFTPMCDSREEIEGFRFWKQGYWKSYLRGLPYHISALFVVDLNRFRELAAGDRLRGHYHQLSADPNSLSNLDQDLPNHMQNQLPIFSLPQDWLWCETWCSDESLGTAKTIDLCNNPMTKEPKLDRARRQVPEWVDYDGEVAELARELKGKGAGGDHLEAGKKEEKEVKVEEKPVERVEEKKGHDEL